MDLFVQGESRELSIIAYTIARENTSYWRGIAKSSATLFWGLNELVTIPMLALFIGQVGLRWQLVLPAIPALILFSISSLVAAHFIIRTYLQFWIPRTIRFDVDSGTISVDDPRGMDVFELKECAWAYGFVLHDTIGDVLVNQPAFLVRLPSEDIHKYGDVLGIPVDTGTAVWESAFQLHNVPTFIPESVGAYISKPPLAVRTLSRGFTLGLVLAPLVIHGITLLVGRPVWVFSTYAFCVLTSVNAASIYAAAVRGINYESRFASRLVASNCVLFFGAGLLTVQHDQIGFPNLLVVLLIHVAVGVIIACFLALAWRVFELHH